MCFRKRKPAEYPLTDRLLTIHGQCFDILADGVGGYRRYTGRGMVILDYHDGAVWRKLCEAEINPPDALKADGFWECNVVLGYGTYRLAFSLAGQFLGGRFGAFCRWGVFDQDNASYSFRLRISDIIKAAAPMLSGDICIYVEGVE